MWTPIVFSWESIPNAHQYSIEAVYYTKIGSTTSASSFAITRVTTNSYTDTDNLSDGFDKIVVYWKVRAIDSKGNYGPYSPTYSFTLKKP